jgi:hypothetical protein
LHKQEHVFSVEIRLAGKLLDQGLELRPFPSRRPRQANLRVFHLRSRQFPHRHAMPSARSVLALNDELQSERGRSEALLQLLGVSPTATIDL